MNDDLEQAMGRCIFREAYDAFWIIDPRDLRVLDVNPAAQRLTGLRRKQLVGMFLYDLISTDHPQVLSDLIRACQTTSFHTATDGCHIQHAKADGSVESRAVHVSVSRIHLEPEPAGLVVMRDVTSWKKAEQALRTSEERFRRLTEQGHLIPWEARTDNQGFQGPPDPFAWQFTYVGPQAVSVFGYPLEDWYKPNFWVDHLHPEDRQQAIDTWKQQHGRSEDFEFEYRMLTADGQVVWIHDLVTPALDEASPVLRGFMVDITARKQSEAERQDLQARVAEAQRLESLGLLAATIAHDFNNLLAAIRGHISFTKARHSASAPASSTSSSPVVPLEALDHIESIARKGSDLVARLLACDGRSASSFGPVDLSALTAEMVQTLQGKVNSKIQLKCTPAPGLPALQGDRTQLQQVILNLLTNALEAIGDQEGTVAVNTNLLTLSEHPSTVHLEELPPSALHPEQKRLVFQGAPLHAGTYLALAVADTGCGIDDATALQIFTPFFTTKPDGRGLGMAAILGIVRRHRGTVVVFSAPGKGTTIRVLFRCAERHE